MNVTPRQQFILVLSILMGVLIAGLCYLWLLRLPQIRNLRTIVDNGRANLIIARNQQTNLIQLQKDIATRRQDQSKLEDEMWSFMSEDNFFLPWNGIAQRWSVKIDDPVIADAVPSDQTVSRAVTINITGAMGDVQSAISAVQALKPLVSISRVIIKPATFPAVTATLSGMTLWKN